MIAGLFLKCGEWDTRKCAPRDLSAGEIIERPALTPSVRNG
jgi:hypothetical protein